MTSIQLLMISFVLLTAVNAGFVYLGELFERSKSLLRTLLKGRFITSDQIFYTMRNNSVHATMHASFRMRNYSACSYVARTRTHHGHLYSTDLDFCDLILLLLK